MSGQPHFEIRESTDSQWYWRLVGGNGEVLASGETHPTRAAARRAKDTTIATVLAVQAAALEAQAAEPPPPPPPPPPGLGRSETEGPSS